MRQKPITQPKPQTPSKGLLAAYRIAITLVLMLAGVLVVGSLYAMARPADSAPLFYLGRQTAANETQSGGLTDWADVSIFSGIGRLRIPLAGQPPATVVLSLSFPYPANDLFFAEELATRIGEFRSIAVGYFSAFTREEIARLDETRAKNEILARYNAMLHLGSIESLYFTDLVILD